MAKKDLVVVGASAGGLQALQDLVGGLPSDLDASVFVVLHISPSGPNLLAEILQRRSSLPVLNPVDGARMETARIYVGQPDHHLLVEGDLIRITRGPRENRSRPSVDALFRSAAYARGARVIGVILTGNLDDGTAGLWAVKQRGGTTVPPVGPGLWVPLPGQVAAQPFWRDQMTPFVSPGAACDPGPPPAFSETPGSQFYVEAFEVYDVSTHLTPEQLTIARYWADGPGTINGVGHSLSTTSEVLAEVDANLEEAAEAFARVGIAAADALLSCWYSKYEYNRIRPISYIRNVIDPSYNTPLPTPPFPEYTSAHSAQTAAALSTLQALFGDVGYTDHTHDVDGFAPRTFGSLSESMLETGISRLYGGIHYRASIFDGFAQGRCVSAKVNALPWRKRERERETIVEHPAGAGATEDVSSTR